MPSEPPLLKNLLETLPQVGTVTWIGVRPERRVPVRVIDAVEARQGKGLVGDRYRGGGRGTREVTLIQHEHVIAVASLLGRDTLDPALLRRNIAVRGINLLALKHRRFQIGEAVLEMTGQAHPCSRMEEVLGPGGYNAMRGHGGITARVVRDGLIRVGDSVRVLAAD